MKLFPRPSWRRLEPRREELVAAVLSKGSASARAKTRSGAKSGKLQTLNRLARQRTPARRRAQPTCLSISAHGTDIPVA